MRERGLVERMCAYNKAISDPSRMKMIKLLGSHEPGTLNVSDIARILKLSQPAATKHLQIMEGVGLFSRQRVGASVYYSINEKNLLEYGRLVTYAFEHRSTPCPYGYDCRRCPNADTCV